MSHYRVIEKLAGGAVAIGFPRLVLPRCCASTLVDMIPERWRQIKDVLDRAMQLLPEQRPAFFRQGLCVRRFSSQGNRIAARR